MLGLFVLMGGYMSDSVTAIAPLDSISDYIKPGLRH